MLTCSSLLIGVTGFKIMSVGVRRTAIRDLAHGSKDFLLVGVIISKQNPKTIRLKSGSGNF